MAIGSAYDLDELLAHVRAILRQCRQSILQRVALDQDADTVFQANFQVFPLTRRDAE